MRSDDWREFFKALVIFVGKFVGYLEGECHLVRFKEISLDFSTIKLLVTRNLSGKRTENHSISLIATSSEFWIIKIVSIAFI
jgi:hypothetical protein